MIFILAVKFGEAEKFKMRVSLSDTLKTENEEENMKNMGTEGIVRKLDELGRVVIPAEFRRSAGINPTDDIEISLERDGTISLKKHEIFCGFCGTEAEHLVEFRGKKICHNCISELTLWCDRNIMVNEHGR